MQLSATVSASRAMHDQVELKGTTGEAVTIREESVAGDADDLDPI